MNQQYRVKGMSCAHCVRAVRNTLEALPGVDAVDVDVSTGTVTLTSEQAIDRSLVRAAVDEAGYQLLSDTGMESGASREPRALCIAIQAAVEAGQYFSARLHAEKTVRSKSSPGDLVTEFDKQCEEAIRSRIFDAFPDHTMLGEESTAPGSEASTQAAAAVERADHLWIVDPIDGTTNFVHQLPLSVVSIGYARDGELDVGVIYDPYRDEVFLGQRGLGSYATDSATATSWAMAPTDSLPGVKLTASAAEGLRGSVLATGFPSRSSVPVETTQVALQVSRQVKSLRAFGAAALHMAYVASGRLDGYWEYDLNAWDLAAGALLVMEAGGCVRDLNGQSYSVSTRDIVATGQPGLADALTQKYREMLESTDRSQRHE